MPTLYFLPLFTTWSLQPLVISFIYLYTFYTVYCRLFRLTFFIAWLITQVKFWNAQISTPHCLFLCASSANYTKHEPTSISCVSHLQSRSLSSWASVVLRPFPRADRLRPQAPPLRRSCLCSSSTFRRETPLRCTLSTKRRRPRMCWHLTE